MRPGQNLYSLTATIIECLKPILEEFTPDYVLVHGDTTTTMAGSIASFYSGAKVCHVEAGLRTYNKLSPFPEEINRQITGRICDYHFAPTETSKKNLLKENISEDSILVTGNTVIDALIKSVEKVNERKITIIKTLISLETDISVLKKVIQSIFLTIKIVKKAKKIHMKAIKMYALLTIFLEKIFFLPERDSVNLFLSPLPNPTSKN